MEVFRHFSIFRHFQIVSDKIVSDKIVSDKIVSDIFIFFQTFFSKHDWLERVFLQKTDRCTFRNSQPKGMTKTNKEKEDVSKKRAASKKLTAQQQDLLRKHFILARASKNASTKQCIQQCL
jgi:hypothetical protein